MKCPQTQPTEIIETSNILAGIVPQMPYVQTGSLNPITYKVSKLVYDDIYIGERRAPVIFSRHYLHQMRMVASIFSGLFLHGMSVGDVA